MTGMLRITEAASLGLHTAVLLAKNPAQMMSTHTIADILRASEAHLSKVLQRLTRAGLVRSVRGPGGGHALGRSAEQITLLDVYEAIEGQIPSSSCLYSTGLCGGRQCIFGSLLGDVNRLVREQLGGTRLTEVLDAGWNLT